MQIFRRTVAPAAITLSLALAGAGCSSGDDVTTTATTAAEGDTSTSSAAALVSRCETTDLNASVADTANEGVVRTVTIALENKTNSDCRLAGYPEVAAFNELAPIVSRAEPIGDVAQNDEAAVTVEPQSSAYLDIQYPQQNAAGPNCSAVTRLTITPPDEVNQLILPLTRNEIPNLCSDTSVGVTAVRGTLES